MLFSCIEKLTVVSFSHALNGDKSDLMLLSFLMQRDFKSTGEQGGGGLSFKYNIGNKFVVELCCVEVSMAATLLQSVIHPIQKYLSF